MTDCSHINYPAIGLFFIQSVFPSFRLHMSSFSSVTLDFTINMFQVGEQRRITGSERAFLDERFARDILFLDTSSIDPVKTIQANTRVRVEILGSRQIGSNPVSLKIKRRYVRGQRVDQFHLVCREIACHWRINTLTIPCPAWLELHAIYRSLTCSRSNTSILRSN